MNVFISYAPSDRDIADSLADTLSECGLEVWQTDEHVLPGENWAKKVGEALEEAFEEVARWLKKEQNPA